MSYIILNKYKIKQRLQSECYPQKDVFIVTDKFKVDFLCRIIYKKKLTQANIYVLDYVKEQVKFLKNINSPYVIKLIESQQNQQKIIIILEYCNGGDLLSIQSRQPNGVFKLDKALYIISHVIKGLECLHKNQYLHRKIHPKTIVMKNHYQKGYKIQKQKQNQLQNQIYKLANFDFIKSIDAVKQTIFNIDGFQAPQMYEEEQGVYVDMWALGELLYFMLNMETPFDTKALNGDQFSGNQLREIVGRFSYRQSVSRTQKKIIQDRQQDLQDLFVRIFQPEKTKRIDFSQIRRHNLFKKYFVIQNPSNYISSIRSSTFPNIIIYTEPNETNETKFKNVPLIQSLNLFKSKQIDNLNPQNEIKSQENIKKDKIPSIILKSFDLQNKIMDFNIGKLKFLIEIMYEIIKIQQLPQLTRIIVGYNLSRYSIMRIKHFLHYLKQKIKPQLQQNKWREYSSSSSYFQKIEQLEYLLNRFKSKYEIYYKQCQEKLNLINLQNKYFSKCFQKDLSSSQEYELEGDFKFSYRYGLKLCYQFLRKKLKIGNIDQNKGDTLLNYQLALVCIGYAYQKIFQDAQIMKIVFYHYLNETNKQVSEFDFYELKQKMKKFSLKQLNSISNSIIYLFFSPKNHIQQQYYKNMQMKREIKKEWRNLVNE